MDAFHNYLSSYLNLPPITSLSPYGFRRWRTRPLHDPYAMVVDVPPKGPVTDALNNLATYAYDGAGDAIMADARASTSEVDELAEALERRLDLNSDNKSTKANNVELDVIMADSAASPISAPSISVLSDSVPTSGNLIVILRSSDMVPIARAVVVESSLPNPFTPISSRLTRSLYTLNQSTYTASWSGPALPSVGAEVILQNSYTQNIGKATVAHVGPPLLSSPTHQGSRFQNINSFCSGTIANPKNIFLQYLHTPLQFPKPQVVKMASVVPVRPLSPPSTPIPSIPSFASYRKSPHDVLAPTYPVCSNVVPRTALPESTTPPGSPIRAPLELANHGSSNVTYDESVDEEEVEGPQIDDEEVVEEHIDDVEGCNDYETETAQDDSGYDGQDEASDPRVEDSSEEDEEDTEREGSLLEKNEEDEVVHGSNEREAQQTPKAEPQQRHSIRNPFADLSNTAVQRPIAPLPRVIRKPNDDLFQDNFLAKYIPQFELPKFTGFGTFNFPGSSLPIPPTPSSSPPSSVRHEVSSPGHCVGESSRMSLSEIMASTHSKRGKRKSFDEDKEGDSTPSKRHRWGAIDSSCAPEEVRFLDDDSQPFHWPLPPSRSEHRSCHNQVIEDQDVTSASPLEYPLFNTTRYLEEEESIEVPPTPSPLPTNGKHKADEEDYEPTAVEESLHPTAKKRKTFSPVAPTSNPLLPSRRWLFGTSKKKSGGGRK